MEKERLVHLFEIVTKLKEINLFFAFTQNAYVIPNLC